MHVTLDGLAQGRAIVDEEIQRQFDSFGAQVERLGVYEKAVVWREEAEA
jgi:hypothetical protein